MKKSGVYKIVNKVTGKYYIGSSSQVEVRWKLHKRCLRRGNHWNILLQRSWNKHGEHAFEFILFDEFCGTQKELLKLEQKYLDEVDRKISLNLSFKATCPDNSHPITKEKSRRTGKKHHHSDKTIYQLKNVFTGETYSGIISDFYNKYSLDQHRTSLMISSLTRSYKGWVLAESNYVPKHRGPNGKDVVVRHFRNVKTNESFVGTQSDLYKKIGRGQSHINDLVSSKSKSYLGWTLTDVCSC